MIIKLPYTLIFSADEKYSLKHTHELELTFSGEKNQTIDLSKMEYYQFVDKNVNPKIKYPVLMQRTMKKNIVTEVYRFNLKSLKDSGFKIMLMSDLRNL